jgi:hypothetical protein
MKKWEDLMGSFSKRALCIMTDNWTPCRGFLFKLSLGTGTERKRLFALRGVYTRFAARTLPTPILPYCWSIIVGFLRAQNIRFGNANALLSSNDSK